MNRIKFLRNLTPQLLNLRVDELKFVILTVFGRLSMSLVRKLHIRFGEWDGPLSI
jgi:hypothetical protein